MKPLMTNQRVFRWLCICPVDENDGKNYKIFYILWSVLSVICAAFGFVASSIFFLNYLSTDLKESIYAILPITSTLNFLYMIINAVFIGHKINAIFKRLAEIFEKCKYFQLENDSNE